MAKTTDANALTLFDFTRHTTNYQPNILTLSKQEFTELEKKIVVLVVNRIGLMAVKKELPMGLNVTVHIPFSELTKVRYDQIAAAAESLQLKRIGYRRDKEEQFDYIIPFPRIRSLIENGRRVIELTMFADVIPYFAELGQRYTKYDIDVMLSLSSVYAQRLFEIVSMFYHRGQREFIYDIAELRLVLNVPDSYSYNDFRKNVLSVAQRELQNKAQLIIDWEPARKEGKRIVALKFFIKTTEQIAAEAVEQDRRQIRDMPLHEAIQIAYKLMSDYKLKDWQKDIIVSDIEKLETLFRVHSELSNGVRSNVKNPTAYLVKSLGLDQVRENKSQKSTQKQHPQGTGTQLSFIANGPDIRTGTTCSVGDLLGGLFPFSNSPEEGR
ncbi:RepB family plasmid replication initiator protein [Rudanella paleaurantiibacter]|uniref:RepB family plasmid replication initiator protein n=1 Tax=Rudanella paleaurantiibacter TaxID=2614655 RepID=A0A7J5TSX0_9BACT|nr:replication initiation protein [Rudanella paleaurantiibacter]KAB7726619.1 RepB family plasmid replication initiator protein [Rudanella paleaurantiibacter]